MLLAVCFFSPFFLQLKRLFLLRFFPKLFLESSVLCFLSQSDFFRWPANPGTEDVFIQYFNYTHTHTHTYVHILSYTDRLYNYRYILHMTVVWKVNRPKNSHDVVISLIDFFDQQDPSTVTAMKEMNGLQGGRGLYWKINPIESHSMRISWSAYELFGWPPYIYIYIYIYIFALERFVIFVIVNDRFIRNIALKQRFFRPT